MSSSVQYFFSGRNCQYVWETETHTIDDRLTFHIFAKKRLYGFSFQQKNTSNPRLVFSASMLLDPATQRFRFEHFQSYQCFCFLVFAWTRRAPSPNIPSFPQINAKGTKIWWLTVFSTFPSPFFSHPCSRTCLFASLSWLPYWSCFHLQFPSSGDLQLFTGCENGHQWHHTSWIFRATVMTALDAENIRPLLQLSFLLQQWPGPWN